MPELNFDELERLQKMAEPLPWKLKLHIGKVIRVTENGNERYIADCLRTDKRAARCKRNAAYITAACNAVPDLIARVRELERQRDWLATFIDDNMDCEQCPYYETICKPQAPVDCAKLVSQKAKDAGQ